MADEIELDDADLLPIEDAPDEAAPEVAEGKSSSLDDVISKALNGDEGDADAQARARDEKGRFAAKTESEANPAPEGTSEAAPVVSTATVQNAQPEISEGHFRGWTPEQRETFGKLPPEAQKTVLDVVKSRDAFYTEKLTDYDYALKATTPLVHAVQPHLDRIRTVTNDPSAYVAHILDVDHRLKFAPYAEKVQLFAELAKTVGIPFSPPQPDVFADPLSQGGEAYPVIHDLKNQVAQQQLELNRFRQHTETFRQQQTDAQIYHFANEKAPDGNQKYPLFEQVKMAMGQLLDKGQANDLADAYAKAVKPIEDAITARAAAQAKTAEDARKAALEKARKARPTVSSGVAPGGRTRSGGLDSILNATLDRAGIQ